MIKFENVGLRYGMGPEILRDLTFDIPRRSFQFLTGPSGAGRDGDWARTRSSDDVPCRAGLASMRRGRPLPRIFSRPQAGMRPHSVRS